MTIRKRTYNPRLVKVSLSYSVQDIADLFGIHKNAVLNWIKDGLPIIDQQRPYLIYGNDLITYLRRKQAGRKRPCGLGEFFCCKCRVPRLVQNNAVAVTTRSHTKLLLSGQCSVCGSPVYRAGSTKDLPKFQKIFLIKTLIPSHITDNPSSIVNSDM